MKITSAFATIAIATSLFAFQNCGSGSSSSSGTAVAPGTLGVGTLVVSPLGGTVAVNSSLPFAVSGGTAPYTYTVTSGSGYFSSSIFVAPSVAETDTVTITDSAGYGVSTTVTVSTTTTSSSGLDCLGSYTVIAGGNTGVLVIATQDTVGDITSGNMNVRSVNGTIAGICTDATGEDEITFTRTIGGQYQIFTGTMEFVNNVWNMNGTYQTCAIGGSCDAGTNTWSAH